MKIQKKIAAAVLAVAAVGGLSFVGADSASANTINSYCSTHFYTRLGTASGLPNQALYCQMQGGPAQYAGYTGPVDGVMGKNSWRGIQKYLHDFGYGYDGPQDGVPGINTYKAMQRAGNDLASVGHSQTVDGS